MRIEDTSGILYMKVGSHAQEKLSDIIVRKTREIERAGFAMWGYGGNTCHPSTMVQPFAKTVGASGGPILLCMQPMDSKHLADPVRAKDYSADGIDWTAVPEGVDVLGSRYALCIENLREAREELDLGDTVVAVGNSQGKRGSDYIKGRVDKACLNLVDHEEDTSRIVEIGLIAELVPPYAVFLRS